MQSSKRASQKHRDGKKFKGQLRGSYMISGRLIVEGNVQGTGYRAFVKQIARRLSITGGARNLPDGTVEILFEADNAKKADAFKKQIDKKGKEGDIFFINVAHIRTDEQKEAREKKFKAFEIEYGMKLNDFQKESLERSEVGILVLSDFSSKTEGNFQTMESKYGGIASTLKELKSGLLKELNEAVKVLKKT